MFAIVTFLQLCFSINYPLVLTWDMGHVVNTTSLQFFNSVILVVSCFLVLC